MGESSLDCNDPRYVRAWKCQVSVGEFYRWILAKLSDKDIKRALHKYRDLMPRQSDWNRKLTQATNIPELGFRYLYRCGQIDESNHRTMQKMLKYIDRQDVLPYFDTLLYNTNNANCSLDELKKVLLDKVDEFLKYSTALTDEEVHPEQPYEVKQCQPLGHIRMTREGDICCMTVAKKPKPSLEDINDEAERFNSAQDLATNVCGQVRSAIMAGGLGGPIVHSLLASSLISMLGALRVSIAHSLDGGSNPVDAVNIASLGPALRGLSPARLLAAVPHLLALAPPQIPMDIQLRRQIMIATLPPHPQPGLAQAAAPLSSRNPHMSAGGVGITASLTDSCMHYYCRLRLRVRIDLGPMPDLLEQIQVARQGAYEQQLDMFAQASNLLNSRMPGELFCSLRFNQLHQLESFWRDYQSGALRRFLTQTLLNPRSGSLLQAGNQTWETEAGAAAQPPQPSWLAESDAKSLLDPLERSIDRLRQEGRHVRSQEGGVAAAAVFVAGFGQGPAPPAAPPPPPPQDEFRGRRVRLHLYVSRRDYENGRCLLMRNLRAIPSLCRLISASKFLPIFAQADHANKGQRGSQSVPQGHSF